MNVAHLGDADGAIGVDSIWKRKLGRLMAETPLATSLLETVRRMAFDQPSPSPSPSPHP